MVYLNFLCSLERKNQKLKGGFKSVEMKKTNKKIKRKEYTPKRRYAIGWDRIYDLQTMLLARKIRLYLDEKHKKLDNWPFPEWGIADWLINNKKVIERELEDYRDWLNQYCRVNKDGSPLYD